MFAQLIVRPGGGGGETAAARPLSAGRVAPLSLARATAAAGTGADLDEVSCCVCVRLRRIGLAAARTATRLDDGELRTGPAAREAAPLDFDAATLGFEVRAGGASVALSLGTRALRRGVNTAAASATASASESTQPPSSSSSFSSDSSCAHEPRRDVLHRHEPKPAERALERPQVVRLRVHVRAGPVVVDVARRHPARRAQIVEDVLDALHGKVERTSRRARPARQERARRRRRRRARGSGERSGPCARCHKFAPPGVYAAWGVDPSNQPPRQVGPAVRPHPESRALDGRKQQSATKRKRKTKTMKREDRQISSSRRRSAANSRRGRPAYASSVSAPASPPAPRARPRAQRRVAPLPPHCPQTASPVASATVAERASAPAGVADGGVPQHEAGRVPMLRRRMFKRVSGIRTRTLLVFFASASARPGHEGVVFTSERPSRGAALLVARAHKENDDARANSEHEVTMRCLTSTYLTARTSRTRPALASTEKWREKDSRRRRRVRERRGFGHCLAVDQGDRRRRVRLAALLRNYLDDTVSAHGFGEISGTSMLAAHGRARAPPRQHAGQTLIRLVRPDPVWEAGQA
ncbi:hypothetical protein GGX14DRAFT_662395 [Mycena pura]|uniref:Uncharacterized protein n=1 Tax=Mycena pura TaxID=153505 RepID=A0AAD6V4E4_9AGAR|nr:hypothetical protein GGX14DRAFT_662395 [Mycena pura]